MSLVKRGEVWHVSFAGPDGALIRQTTGTKDRKQAQEYHDRLKAEVWRVSKLGERPSRTWDDAALQWLKETDHKKTHAEDAAKIKWLTQYYRGVKLENISRHSVQKILADKSPSTANRYTALIRSILNKAKDEWQWIDTVPKFFMYSEGKRRIRTLTQEQVWRLMTYLPEHQKDMVILALCTGLRQGNVKNLLWSQVDLTQRAIFIEDTKNGERLGVPLNDTAYKMLERRYERRNSTYVFTYRGNKLQQVGTKCFRRALLASGIPDFRWHDLRHVWACWHVEGGTPLFALQELAGWKSESMVRRYAHLSPDHLRQYTKNTQPSFEGCGTGGDGGT